MSILTTDDRYDMVECGAGSLPAQLELVDELRAYRNELPTQSYYAVLMSIYTIENKYHGALEAARACIDSV